MRILVGCEWSGRLRDALIDNGWDETYSVDLEDGKGTYRDHHIKGDVLTVLNAGWDAGIFFPPCTYLSVIGNSHYVAGAPGSAARHVYREAALLFVEELLDAPILKIALENPVGVISTRIRKPDQYIQPYEYGDPWQKKTCLWLKNLPLLVPTCRVTPNGPWVSGATDRGGAHKNSKMRGMTFRGIALAMADQWFGHVDGCECSDCT